MPSDLLGREIHPGDYVVFHNCIYQVVDVPNKSRGEGGYVKIMLYNPSKTTRPVKKHSTFLCIIPKEDIIVWKLKQGY
jgi:hypothetical protein